MQKNTIKEISINSALGVINRLVTIILGLVFRKIFITNLGDSLSGLSSLYTNLLNFLALATAGLSLSALQKIFLFNSTGDIEAIRKLERFTEKFYRLVSVFILVIGFIFCFFLDKIIYNNSYSKTFLRLVFLIQVFSECIGYLYYSKKLILQAYSELFVISIIEIIANIVFYIIQIFLIIKYKNYLIYIVTVPLKYFLIGFFEKKECIKLHPWLRGKIKSSFHEMRYIFSDLKNTIIMQISQFIFLSTDSIVISKFLGLTAVNKYDNYLIILNSITSVVDEVNSALRSTFGMRIADNDSTDAQNSFVITSTLLSHVIGSFCGLSFFYIVDIFITIWLDESFIINKFVIILMTANFYIINISSPLKNIMVIKGLFNSDKKVTLTGAIINIVLSILFIQYIGLSGVILGTLIGNFFMFVSRIFYFFNLIGKKFLWIYMRNIVLYLFIFLVQFVIMNLIFAQISISNIILRMLFMIFVCCIIPNVINLIVFHNETIVLIVLRKIREKIKK